MMRTVIVVAVGLTGCMSGKPATTLQAGLSPVAVESCTRVSRASLGQLPLELEVGGKVVRFAEWTTAEEGSDTYFGFATQLPEGVRFTVEAGDRTFASSSPRWLHPLGVAGPRVAPIDSVTFCTASMQPVLALAP